MLTLRLPQFVEYDQRAHRLHTLASFSFWVTSMYSVMGGTPSGLGVYKIFF